MPHRKHTPTVKPLLLAGGPSTRLGFPKHLLRMPDGRPLYQHQLDRLHRACPGADALYVSVSRSSVLDGFLRDVARPLLPRGNATPGPIATIYDREFHKEQEAAYDREFHKEQEAPCDREFHKEQEAPCDRDYHKEQEGPAALGPVAGLLAAHEADPDAAWLVLACDYALLTDDALARVRDLHEGDLTCVRGPAGEAEPLVGVWSPEALRKLAALARSGQLDGNDDKALASIVTKCGGLVVDPPEPRARVMRSVETEADWHEVYKLASEEAAAVKKDRVAKASSIQARRGVVV